MNSRGLWLLNGMLCGVVICRGYDAHPFVMGMLVVAQVLLAWLSENAARREARNP